MRRARVFDVDMHTCWRCEGRAGHLRTLTRPDTGEPGYEHFTRVCARCEHDLRAEGWHRETRREVA